MGTGDLLILIVGLAFAGFAKGITGMGLPLVATPILAGVFGPKAAVVIVTIPIFAANSLLLLQGWRRLDVLRGIAPIILASAIGTAVGVNLLALLDQRTFAILIAVMVVIFLLRGDRLIGDDPGARRARILGPAVGFVGGVLQGTTSIASPLIGSFFHARKMDRHEYVIVLAAIFELNAAIQLVGYSLLGLYTPDIVAIGLVGLVPTLLALMAGIYFRGRLDPVRFRQLIVVLLVFSVANLLWRTFGS
ncbi:MAG TPA: sulfite exporter TauE/SafE family protein [Candidatus Limnocylindria bacterium]